MDRLVVLLEAKDAGSPEALVSRLRELADAAEASFVVSSSPEAALSELEAAGRPNVVVVLSPAIDKPLSTSRRIARAHPKAHLVLLVEPMREPALRRDAVFGAPRGGRWSILTPNADALGSTIASAIQAGRQESRLRTTLDAISQRVTPRLSIDAVEIRRLVVSDRYLASVLLHAHDAIVSLDGGGHVISWNAGAERLFGLPDTDVRGREFATLFDDAEAFRRTLAELRSGNESRDAFSLATPRQQTRVDAVFDRIADDTGAIAGFAVILRDVSEQHRAQQTLLDSNRQKDEFLAMLGHELRNPLAPIRTAAQVISMLAHENPRARTAAGIIERQVAHMTRLVDDLLDVARVTRGMVSLAREPVQLSTVVREAIEQVQPTLTAEGHELALQIDDERVSVSADRKRLVQVVTNLLGNAAKYTHKGGRISLSVQSSVEEATITVVDNGVGIDPELLPRVFDLFAQGERPADRALGGLGLGLALVKTIVQLHDGRVEASSPGPGGGSRFAVHLPKLCDSSEALSPADAPKLSRPRAELKIMLVDDNADAVHTLSMLLEMLGHRVYAETDPRDALAHAPDVRPDIFLLDIGMPYLDGYELARRLRADNRLGNPMLIALTGYGQPADVASSRDAGFDHHLVKPLEIEKLELLLQDATSTENEGENVR